MLHILVALCLLLISCGDAFFAAPAAYRGNRGKVQRTRLFAEGGDGAKGLEKGAVVVVCGASGVVGRMAIKSLVDEGKYSVRAVVRNPKAATGDEGPLAGLQKKGLEVVEGDITQSNSETLRKAMQGASAVVALTGTTAFPTQKWRGGNTPDKVDNQGVANMLEAAVAGGKLKRFLFLSSIGVERRGGLPFSILNLFGVLDAKAMGEDRIRSASEEEGFEHVIIRPGRLVDEPSDDPNKGTKKGPVKLGVEFQRGDSANGDIMRKTVADIFVQTLDQPNAGNKTFTAVNVKGKAPTQEEWDAAFEAI